MTTSASPPQTSRTIRTMQGAMHVLFVVLLVGLVRAIESGSHTAGRITCVLAAAGLFVAIYLSGLLLERRAQSASSAAQAGHAAQLWIVVLVFGWVALVAVAHDFAWVAFGLYFLVLHIARRYLACALIAIVFVGSVVALNLNAATRNAGSVIGPLVGMIIALGIAWIYLQLRRENEARTALVHQLMAAQDDVLAAQEELVLAQHEAGALAERERLARDIHDTLAQSFSSIILLSRAGLAHAPAEGLLQQIDETASQGLQQAREVVHALAPTELQDTPLFSALERLAARLHEQGQIAMRCELEGTARALPASIDVALLRIAQGALANVRLHSQATRAGITLTYQPDAVDLEIIDDGVGFTDLDVAQAPLSGSGFGLRAIRERVEALAGTLTVESAPGDGAALLVHIPIPEGLS